MTPTSERQSRSTIDRRLGWLIALGGCIVILDQTIFTLSSLDEWSTWWNGGSLAVVLAIIVLAVGGQVLPQRVLTTMWWALPIAYMALQATWLFGYRGAHPDTATPWLWTVEPAIVTMLLLMLRPAVAVVTSMAISFTPAVSSLLAIDMVPPGIARDTPDQLGNVVYLVIFIGVRLQLQRLHTLESEAHRQARRQVKAAVLAEQQTRVSRIVHDEVLSVLSTAMQSDGTPSTVLRAAAARAMTVLDESAGEHAVGGDLIPVSDAVALMVGNLEMLGDGCAVETRVTDGVIRRQVADAISLAAAEAMRNSVRHAGDLASRLIEVSASPERLQVLIIDDGVGFVPDEARSGMGIPESIERRMADCGGSASIRSRPGQGTAVTLVWPM
ncbi:sensor histidine kinase [Plantibacter sp. Mn2098]|uniref:sensor histidine kinase n=1 Tax=Plantibacter sp. Mn2098 TaxID=3395266 RepID=UPI003BD210D7